MTMHIYFNKDKDGYKSKWSGYVERSLARRFCENGIAIPYQKHLDNIYDAELAMKEAEKKEQEAIKKAEDHKKEQAAIKKAEEVLTKKPEQKKQNKRKK